MGSLDRQKLDMGPREYGPDVGVNPGEVPEVRTPSEVSIPALNEILEKIKQNPDWVPPRPEEEEQKKGPTIN
jgi:hypothetical protein